MERVQFIEHRGARILSVDYSWIATSDELRQAVGEANGVIRAQPLQSVLVLANVEGVPYNMENVSILREAVAANRPYVRARAVHGLSPIAHLSFRALAQIGGPRMESFPDAETARDWLAALA